MVDFVSVVYRLIRVLRVMCAGYQVADAVANLSKMVGKMDELETKVQSLSEQLQAGDYGAEGNTSQQSDTGRI